MKVGLFVFGILLAASSSALAAEPAAKATKGIEVPMPSRHRLVFQSLTATQVNPLGLQTELRIDYRLRLFDSRSLLLRDSYVGVGFIGKLNPAFCRLGAAITAQPIAALILRAQWEWRAYWGAFANLLSFAGPGSEHDDATRNDLGQQNRHYPSGGQQVTLQAIVRAKVGPIAFVNDFAVLYFKMNLENGDRVFYDAFIDALVPSDGAVLANHAHLLWVSSFGFIAGVRYTLMHALYPDSAFPPGVSRDNPSTPTHRVGPLFGYTFSDKGRFFKKPTVVAFFNWWVKHRYRTGQKISQALPYIVVAFRFTGDLWSSR